MTDREKVIKEIEDALSGNLAKVGYIYGLSIMGLKDKTLTDALALLKQEAVKPVKTRGYNPPVYTHYKYECEECKSTILQDQPYCCGCGKEIVWE